jgi:hypothetical protein
LEDNSERMHIAVAIMRLPTQHVLPHHYRLRFRHFPRRIDTNRRMARGHFRSREEIPDKPNQNHNVPGADRAMGAAPNPLLRRKSEVTEKPNENFLVCGAEEAPLSARIKRKQEITAKPNMYDMNSHDYQWKVIGGVAAERSRGDDQLGGRSRSHDVAFGGHGGGMVAVAASAAGGPLSRPSTLLAPDPLPADYHPHPPAASSSQLQPEWERGNIEPRRLAPLLPSVAVHAPDPSSHYHKEASSSAPPVSQPSAWYGNALVSDLERLIARNQEDAQRSFLRL